MDAAPIQVLLIDDDPEDRDLAIAMLDDAPQAAFAVAECDSLRQAADRLAEETFDVIIADLGLLDSWDIDTVRSLRRLDGHCPLIVLTGENSDDTGIAALREGAQEYLCKNDLSPGALSRSIRYAIERKSLEMQLTKARLEEQEAHRELKEAQAQLVQSAKMAAVGELAAGVAHEINNPLAFVRSHIDTIARKAEQLESVVGDAVAEAGPLLDKIQRRSRETEEGMHRILEIVTKLRTFSRLDEGEVKAIDVAQSVDSALTLLRHKCGEEITITQDLADTGPLVCMPGPFNQVLLNLLSNAIDAIDGAGGGAGRVEIVTRRTEADFFLTIADSGCGIPQEIQSRVFDPFFTTKPVGKGTGLGLSISYQIIQAHHGTLSAGPNSPRGSLFTITIPNNLAEIFGDGAPTSVPQGV